MKKIFFLALTLLLWAQSTFAVIKTPRHIFLLRHGEIKNDGTMDPSLSNKGNLRALTLAKHLSRTKVDNIIVSRFKRTKETARHIKKQEKTTVHEITDSLAVVKFIQKSKEKNIVVVGHSDTLPFIIMGLKGPAVIIKHSDYSGFYTVTLENNDFKGLSVLEY